MVNIKKELDSELENITKVFLYAKDTYLYAEYFHNPTTKEELDFVMNSAHSRNMRFILHVFYRTAVIELAKLYSKSNNDKFRLHRFINLFKVPNKYSGLGIEDNIIAGWEAEIDAHSEIIESVRLLRNKIYAHTDLLNNDYDNIDLSFKKIETLLILADNILKQIYLTVFNTGLDSRSPSFDRERFGILKLLAKAEQERIKEIYNRHRNRLEE